MRRAPPLVGRASGGVRKPCISAASRSPSTSVWEVSSHFLVQDLFDGQERTQQIARQYHLCQHLDVTVTRCDVNRCFSSRRSQRSRW